MRTNEELTELVFDEADAKVCSSCGKRSAVRTKADPVIDRGYPTALLPRADTTQWFCFECGYEE